jgi:hypothetical protein
MGNPAWLGRNHPTGRIRWRPLASVVCEVHFGADFGAGDRQSDRLSGVLPKPGGPTPRPTRPRPPVARTRRRRDWLG